VIRIALFGYGIGPALRKPDAGRVVWRNYSAVGQDLAHVVEHDYAVA